MFVDEYISLNRLKKMVESLCRQASRNDLPITLEFIMKSMYPNSYFNYLNDLQLQYDQGYEDGMACRKKKKIKPKKKNPALKVKPTPLPVKKKNKR